MIPKHIFLSYSSDDLERARTFVSLFEQSGWSVWWDREAIPPGAEYRQAIADAIENVNCVVVLWSASAVQKKFVIDEAEAANNRGVLIPVLLDDVTPPLGFRTIENARLADWHGESTHPELKLLLDAIASRAGAPTQRSTSIADAYFHVQREIVSERTRRFVGRSRAIEWLDQFIETHERGYFVIRGDPGQGKTALASWLVKDRGYLHHFARRDTNRADLRLAIRSLLAQLPVGDRRLPDTTPELTDILYEQLALRAVETGRAVLLVDALDELTLPPAGQAAFPAFEALPGGVFIIVTSRPGTGLERLVGRIADAPHVVYDLGPLDPAEAASLIRSQRAELSERDVKLITDTGRGNPFLLRTILASFSGESGVESQQVASGIEAYFRQATRVAESSDGDLLRRVLGLLAAARRPLSLQELAQLTGVSQRKVDEAAIQPVRAYLFETERRYTFYHELFGEFVRASFLYEDEIAASHRALARWLTDGIYTDSHYRMTALAYHLFHAGDHEALTRYIDSSFLGEKVRRYGYGVLEDMELLSRSYLRTGDPRQLEACVQLIESLRKVVGGEIVKETEALVRGAPLAREKSLGAVLAPPVPVFAGIDAYIGMQASGGPSADFVELFVAGNRLFGVIGDVPGRGLKSAFVARFLANLARQKIAATDVPHLPDVLADVRRTTAKHEYFDSVTIQLIEVDRSEGVMGICNGGHPHPVRYRARTGQFDRLPVRGAFLSPLLEQPHDDALGFRHVEIEEGDVVALFSDGLTEAGVLREQPYGYQFESVIREHAAEAAKTIGEAIMADWVRLPRQAEYVDDVTLVILAVRSTGERRPASQGIE